ncbi:hypothetical protein C8J57DRAFT_1721161 [Mycena rebaudengoi]|nr:hypothetical protein C8J57DRAFT_1721161 [Mycena rebaudengoi]
MSANRTDKSSNSSQEADLYRRWWKESVNAPRPARATLHQNWHKPAQPLPMPWHPTSDWEELDGRYIWLDTLGGIPLIEEMFTTVFRVAVHGAVEPLAFRIDGPDTYFMFAAEGRYYKYDSGELKRCEGEFASKDGFLQREMETSWSVVPPQPGFDKVS